MADVGRPQEHRLSARALAAVTVGTAGISLCVTTLFLGMRAILATGTGFVAIGGPYVIEHPAPDWVWVIPVSIVSGFAFGGLHTSGAMRLKGFTIAIPVWVALFLALGWNFLEFGLQLTGDGGIVWGWLVPGIVFVLMAAAPLMEPVLAAYQKRRYGWEPPPRDPSERLVGRARSMYLALHVVAAFIGLAAGIVVFGAIAG